MAAFNDPFDPHKKVGGGCSCGEHSSQHEHDNVEANLTDTPEDALNPAMADVDDLTARCVETAVLTSIFGGDANRRKFLRAVGSGTLGDTRPGWRVVADLAEAAEVEFPAWGSAADVLAAAADGVNELSGVNANTLGLLGIQPAASGA